LLRTVIFVVFKDYFGAMRGARDFRYLLKIQNRFMGSSEKQVENHYCRSAQVEVNHPTSRAHSSSRWKENC